MFFFVPFESNTCVPPRTQQLNNEISFIHLKGKCLILVVVVFVVVCLGIDIQLCWYFFFFYFRRALSTTPASAVYIV